MLSQVVLGVVLSAIVLSGNSQDFVPVDILLHGFMDKLQYNITTTLEEPTEEAMRFMDQQRNVMSEILRKLDNIENELLSLQECCKHNQESMEWSKGLCSRAARTCPRGWHTFNNSCYYISNTPGTWKDGLGYCRSIGADYVQISSFAEWDFVSGLIEEKTWLGLNDQDEEGTFRWSSDKSLPQYNKWMSGEPNDYYGDEDCVISHPYYDNHWNDINCDSEYKFACEVTLETMYS
ncbi:CD209 antigen-like isoform X2 [Macrobrachium nipponense]|uniref:CD209 antigen-like isoform X2 n=1 Tax=Macrobrachium nipponense TaxID=159736 RepID=UPI0030C7BAD4